MLTMLASSTASAVSFAPSSFTVVLKYGETPLNGINIAVCRVAEFKEESDDLVFEAVPAFAGAGADFTNLTQERNIALAASLNTYALANGVARSSKVTDNAGKSTFADLPAGLYLVAQMDSANSEYIIAPYLVSVPQFDEVRREWNYNVVAYPKTEPLRRDESVSVSVFKVWAGIGSHPSSVSVQLYKNGAPQGTAVTLNAANFWHHTWNGLKAGETWTVDEVNVPAGYTKTVSGNATVGFVITNTKDGGTTTTTPGGSTTTTTTPGGSTTTIPNQSTTTRPSQPTTSPYQPTTSPYQPTTGPYRTTTPNPTYQPPTNYTQPGQPGNPPKTSDESNMQLWLALIILSVMGLIVLACSGYSAYRRRKKAKM